MPPGLVIDQSLMVLQEQLLVCEVILSALAIPSSLNASTTPTLSYSSRS